MHIDDIFFFMFGGLLVYLGIRSAYNPSPIKEEGLKHNVPNSISRWSTPIFKAYKKTGVSPYLIAAVIMTESSGDPNAGRRDGDLYSRGLMQITMPAAKDVGYKGSDEGLYDPKTNILVGSKYLAYLMKRFDAGSYTITNGWEKAVAAYNAGAANIKNHGIINPGYVNKIKNLFKQYRGV